MKQVVILGFSVLTGALHAKLEGIKGPDFQIKAIGLGGHHYNYLNAIFDKLLASYRPDVIIFELLSTPCRHWAKEESFRDHLNALVARARDLGAQVGFLHLYRFDVIQRDDMLFRVCSEISAKHNIPSLNLAGWVADAFPAGDFQSVLSDGVHANPKGAEVFGEMIRAFIKGAFCDRKLVQDLSQFDVHPQLAKSISFDARDLAVRPFREGRTTKYGVTARTVVLPAGRPVQIVPPDATTFVGLYLVNGALTGDVVVQNVIGESQTISSYDKFSYYERLRYFPLTISQKAMPLTLTQSETIPDIPLLKGSPNIGKRRGQLAFVTANRS